VARLRGPPAPRIYHDVCIGLVFGWDVWDLSGAFLRGPIPVLGSLGPVLTCIGLLWLVLGLSWTCFGPSCAHLSPVLGHLGLVLGLSWSSWVCPGPVLGCLGAVLGPS
jgi:hypothetical protein